MNTYQADLAYLPSGWQENVLISVEDGVFKTVIPDTKDCSAERLTGALLPGMPNLHSHAFQRALAGLTEHTIGHPDTFWTWREAMYKLAKNFTPDRLEAVASQLYQEMLAAGYTSVVEFHYVHQPDPLAMSNAIIKAALQTGIRLTLLPVLYQQSDFNKLPPNEGQQLFYLSLADYLELIAKLEQTTRNTPTVHIGIAPHSLRAVSPDVMRDLLDARPEGVRHMHIAEQTKEVDDCLAAYAARPVEWLLANFSVDDTWCLIHCTHMLGSERSSLAKAGAVVGLCPTTEGNLGDGFFELHDYLDKSGRFGIGTDSNTSVSPIEELRLLEYVQRLRHQKRNIAAGRTGSSGERLFTRALAGGAQASGQKVGRIEAGYAADVLRLDTHHPTLLGHGKTTLLDAFVFSGSQNPVDKVMVAGEWIGASRRVQAGFTKTMQELLS